MLLDSSRPKFFWVRKKEPLDNLLFERPDYLFDYEDKSTRDVAKRALSFSAPNTFLDNEEKHLRKSDRFYSIDHNSPASAFDFDRAAGAENRFDDVESSAQYGTIFTYSDLPHPGVSLFDHEVAVPGRSAQIDGGFAYLLHALSILILLLGFPVLCWIYIKRLSDNERLIVYRLGRRLEPKGPGFVILLPFCDHFYTVRLDDQSISITPVSGGTQDEAIVEVHCTVVYCLFDLDYAYQSTKESPSKLVDTQAQLSLLSSLSRLTWIQLDKGGGREDLANQTMGTLNINCGSHGIQISHVEISDILLVRSAPSPSTTKKNNMSIIQKQLHALTSAFLDKSAPRRTSMRTVSVDSSAVTSSTADQSPEVVPNITHTSADFTNDTSVDTGSKDSHLSSLLHTVCDQVIGRAQPFLNNGLVCSALGHAVMQLVVSSVRPQRPLPLDSQCQSPDILLVRLDAKCGRASKGPLFPGSQPDVTILVCATDLVEIMAGRLDIVKAINDQIIYISGDKVLFDKLRHLLYLQQS